MSNNNGTAITIEKAWDGNECESDGSNGRIYTSRGRWQWIVVVNGVTDSAHDRKREAAARVAALKSEQRGCQRATVGALCDCEACTASPAKPLGWQLADVYQGLRRIGYTREGATHALRTVCGCSKIEALRLAAELEAPNAPAVAGKGGAL